MIRFLTYWKLYASISAAVIVAGILSIIFWGYTYSIDFTGGTNLSYQFAPAVDATKVRALLEKQSVDIVMITPGKDGSMDIRLAAIDEQKEQAVRTMMEKDLKTTVTVLRADTVGPVIGAETLQKTAIAAALAMVGILIYVAYAFKNVNFALAAIAALFHDIIVVIGTYSIISHFFNAELDTMFVTALLTAMSFSVHDTIVVFDQIREYRNRYGSGHIAEYADKALTDTMVRSFNNSFTIVFMLISLVLLGGSTIRFFAVALLIGTITGTYSSPFVATPIAVWLEKRKLAGRKPA